MIGSSETGAKGRLHVWRCARFGKARLPKRETAIGETWVEDAFPYKDEFDLPADGRIDGDHVRFRPTLSPGADEKDAFNQSS